MKQKELAASVKKVKKKKKGERENQTSKTWACESEERPLSKITSGQGQKEEARKEGGRKVG